MKLVYLLLTVCLLSACHKDDQFVDVNEMVSYRVPSGKHLEIINNQLHLDGQPFKIVEANSPESRLRECSFAELDQLNSCGINTIYATLYGGDATDVHPFNNRNNPSQGFNEARVNTWLAYLEHWIYDYPEKHIVHLLLSEKENHFTLSEANHKAMITYLTTKFKSIEGYVIYDREELPTGKSAYINNYYSFLKTKAPYSIRAVHNNTNENPWSGFSNNSDTLIQFLSFQEWQGNFDRRIRSQVTSSTVWAGYSSEVTGGFQTFPSCSTLTATLCNAGGNYSSGMGFFISSKDQSPPTFHGPYCGCYQYANSLLNDTENDTIITTPTTMEIVYSPNFSLSPSTVLTNGATLPTGGMWFGVRTGTGTYTFKLQRGTSTQNFTDNSAPYQFKANWLQEGSYTLTVNNTEIRSFWVQ